MDGWTPCLTTCERVTWCKFNVELSDSLRVHRSVRMQCVFAHNGEDIPGSLSCLVTIALGFSSSRGSLFAILKRTRRGHSNKKTCRSARRRCPALPCPQPVRVNNSKRLSQSMNAANTSKRQPLSPQIDGSKGEPITASYQARPPRPRHRHPPRRAPHPPPQLSSRSSPASSPPRPRCA